MATIAIIGAGIAGAACAAALKRQGHQLRVFDKGRAAGGRMSSKRTANGYADLGAQYFTARTELFNTQCQHWVEQGVIALWQPRIAVFESGTLTASPDSTRRYIGVPSMHKPVQQLLQHIELRTQCLVNKVERGNNQWRLFSGDSHVADVTQLVLAIPQQQARALLHDIDADFSRASALFATPALLPCWAVSIELPFAAKIAFDAIFVRQHGALSWLARQNTKPGRGSTERWLLHFSARFSQAHIHADEAFICQVAVAELQRILAEPVQPVSAVCHRWRYALQSETFAAQGPVWSAEHNLGLCGDWLNGGRVENAWLSGTTLAQEIGI